MKLALTACCADAQDGANGEPTCVFGCGSVVDPDTRMCPTCHEHSAPSVVCGECGTMWELWGEEWERTATEA